MADWGSIATLGNLVGTNNGITPPAYVRGIVSDSAFQTFGGKDTTEGDPSQPCLRLDARGYWRFRWSFSSGARSVSISVKQPDNQSPRPSLIVKANPDCGVNADVTGTAASGTGWVTIGPVNINPSSAGAVWVELHANYDAPSECYWDEIVTT